tara:strand:- start:950 stop:1723 length:774 start_codon:yes stop_codon:yes gene_type:complete
MSKLILFVITILILMVIIMTLIYVGARKRRSFSRSNFATTLETPKIIHQTWKSESLPENYRRWSENCKSVHKDWEYKLWTDEDNRKFIADNYPHFLDIYDSYDVNIKRVDAVRYFYIYHFGGIYMDMDFICLKNLAPLLQPGMAVFGYQDKAHSDISSVANAFMAAPPKHPLFKKLIDNLHKTKNKHVLSATGPDYLTKAIHKHKYKDVVVHPMPIIYTHEWNKKNDKLTSCESDIEQCRLDFPDSYTSTIWTGSWL